MTDPTVHALAAILLATLMFIGFSTGRIRVEIICLLTIVAMAMGLYFFPIPGMAPKDGLVLAFEGFGHHALITICALMIMGRGLVVTGALDPAARILAKVWHVNKPLGLLITLIAAMGMSMIVNDTPVLVLLIPIMAQLAASGGMPSSKTLIPINAAVLIGGMASTIGTSTNLLVMSVATDLGMPAMTVFQFTPIVLMAAVVALPYIWLVMPRLLPDNSPAAGYPARRFVTTLRMVGDETIASLSMEEMQARLPEGIEIKAVEIMSPNVRMTIEGTHEALEEAMRITNATAAPTWLINRIHHEARAQSDDVNFVEMAIAIDSRLIGQSLTTAGLRTVAVVGIDKARRFEHITSPDPTRSPFAEGDVLLVMGTKENLQNFANESGLLMLDGAKEMPRTAKASLALVIMAGAVALASFGLLPIAISALGGAVLMFVTGCVKLDRVGRALSTKVIVLIAASIAIGKLILVSGAAEWLAQLLSLGLQFLPAAGVLAAIMIFVTILTNFASNATAAAVGTPIAFSIATNLGLPVEPLVLAVLFGCNLCYATPVAYQTNMLIMVEGKYVFKDYIRTGLPLVAIMIVTLSTLLVWHYGL